MYKEITVSSELSKYIQCYWYITDVYDTSETILPDGCFDIVVDINENSKNNVILTGIWIKPIEVTITSKTTFGVRFYPSALNIFFNGNIADLINQSYELTANKLKYEAVELIDKLHNIKEYNELQKTLNIYFTAVVKNNSIENDLIIEFMDKYEKTIEYSASKIGISSRQLSRKWNNYIGISPKNYLNILRFINAEKLLVTTDMSLLEIALECGYYDQNHFNKEFKRFSDYTPLVYRKQKKD